MSQPSPNPPPARGPSLPANDRDPTLPPTVWQLFLRWSRRLAIGAVGASLIIHSLAALIAAGVVVGGWHPGEGASAGTGAVEMAVMSEGELDALSGASMGVETPAVPDTPVAADTSVATSIIDPGAGEGASSGGDLTDVGSLAGGGDVGSGQGLELGGSGGGGGAKFFGVEARGNRFAYIVDVSSSMEGGRIEQLRRALTASIDALLETSEFAIVQFSTDSRVVGERTGWTQASPAGKKNIKIHIGMLFPDGATNPVPGFQIISAIRPRPDAIYFMTDGEFTEEGVEAIIQLSREMRAPVHCICLESNEGESKMRRIAQSTRGTYTYVPPR